MTNRNRFKLPILLLVLTAAAIILSGCGDGTTTRLTEDEIDYLTSSYIMLRGDEELPESRAAWNAMSNPLEFPYGTATTVTSGPAANYPEKGQKTRATITTTDEDGIYLVTNVTEYPNKENVLSSTTESYYVNDNISTDDVGMYTLNDPLWDKEGGGPDFNKRLTYQTEYQNGTVRYEAVEATTMTGGTQYAAFAIDGSLDYPETVWSPTDDTGAADQSNYSSRVRYIQEEGSSFSYWPENKIVIGARYYTEHGDTARPTRTSVAYEKVIKTDTALTNLKDKIGDYSGRLFSDGTNDVTLAETVIRYEIQPNGKKTVNTETVIYDAAGNVKATLGAEYLEGADGTVTKPGKPAATYP